MGKAIAIATAGRFHVLDLAKELISLGHDVTFYSYLPSHRTERYGLTSDRHSSLFYWAVPLLAIKKVLPLQLQNLGISLLNRVLDAALILRLKRCDIFICMSGVYPEAARFAKRKFGAKIVVERGSQHILSQRQVQNDIRQLGIECEKISSDAIQRELASYHVADLIMVPAKHVVRSFKTQGVYESKIVRVPYGVNLERFPPTERVGSDIPTILFVGGWSYRKGVDVLIAAWSRLSNVRLLHVGPVIDAPLPQHSNFVHIGAVPESRLVDYYAQGDIFVLASREEGLALVQCQALACGLPIVCTDRTGGEDLKDFIEDPSCIAVVEAGADEALAREISRMLSRVLGRRSKGVRDLLGTSRNELSWKRYGQKYNEVLSSLDAAP